MNISYSNTILLVERLKREKKKKRIRLLLAVFKTWFEKEWN